MDLVVITKGKVDIHRTYDQANPRPYSRIRPYDFPRGSTGSFARSHTRSS